MSDINLEFTVSNNNIDFTVAPNDITITPTDIQLTLSSTSGAVAGGNTGELQYKITNLQLGGVPNTLFDGSNLTLGNVANLKITGGINGYVLQTDGTGNLDWTAQTGNGGGNGSPGGSNTQIQYNDSASFGGNAGFTFNEITGNVNIPGNLTVVGNIIGNTQTAYLANYATIANSVAGANVSGAVAYATTANSVAGANVSGQVANALIAGTVYTNAQPNITSLGTLTSLSVSGNVTANYFLGNGSQLTGITNATNISNGNSNVNIVTANGNVTIASAGNNIVTVTGTGVNVAGTLNATGNANSSNLGTGRVIASGNISGTQLISTIATGTAPFVVTSQTTVANLRVAVASTANTANTVTVNAQPNITSVGILGNLLIGGPGESLVVTNIVQAGGANIANIYNANGAITANRVTANTYIDQIHTFATVPSTVFGYQRTMISDANTTTFNAIVGGGGSNIIPIFWNGTNWRVG